MRLSKRQQDSIRSVVAEVVGPRARVHLFGSRTDDAARGGDIDLLVVSDEPVTDPQRATLTLTARLQRRLGDQPIDVLLIDPETTMQPVHQEALRTGVPL
jgi:predicted nucleotidyltransferase